MTCREVIDFLMSYLDGDLPSDQRARFEGHLAACTVCVVYIDRYLETVKMGKAACAPLDAPVTDEIPEELVRAILAARDDTRG